MSFRSMKEIIRANEARGDRWFSEDAMRFFDSRIESRVINGRYFITSEQPPYAERKYSIREASDDGEINTVGEFWSYDTLDDAREALEEL